MTRSPAPRSPRTARATAPPPRLAPLLAIALLALLPPLEPLGPAALRGQEAPAAEGEAKPAPVLSVEEIVVEPADPGPDTLCRLRVKLKNSGDRIASQLGFAVRINGQDLPVYGNQLFMYPLEPGAVSELKLYNFWTTETSRPMPADGRLALEVELKEAVWMDISTDADGVEVWTPQGAIEGLPVSAKITLAMKKG